MKAKGLVAVIGAVGLVATASIALFFFTTDRQRDSASAAFNCSTFRTRPVDKFNGVAKVLLTYTGVGFRGSYGDMWFFVSRWRAHSANVSTGTLQWSCAPKVKAVSPFAIDNGLMFFGGYDGGHAVRIRNGELLWSFPARGQSVLLAPVVSNDIVYFVGDQGAAFAVERQTGEQLWAYNAKREITASPVPFGKLLLLLLDRTVVAIDPAGRKRWEVEFEFGHPCWARVVGDVACVRSSGAELYGIRNDGAVVFKKDAETAPTVQGSVLYYGLTDGSVQAYDVTALKAIWTRALGSPLASDPLLHPGKLLCLAAWGTLFALAPDSGEQLWSRSIPKPINGLALLAGDSYVCVLTGSNHLYAFDIATGQDLWTRKLAYRVSPADLDAVNNTILARTFEGELRALDGSTGNEIWRTEQAKHGGVSAGHVVEGDLIYFSTVDGAFHCAAIRSGREKWSLRPPGVGVEYSPLLSESDEAAVCASSSGNILLVPFDLNRRVAESFQTDAPLSCSPAVGDNFIYFGHENGVLDCYKHNEKLWEFRADGSIVGPPVVSKGDLYLGSEGGFLYKVNAKTGDLVWTFKTGGPIRVSPAVGQRAVYVGSDDEHVYAVSAAGDELWRFRVAGAVISSPASHGKALFVGDSTGKFFALDLESGEEIWSSQLEAVVSSNVGVYGGKVFFGCGNGSFYALDGADGAEKWRIQTTGSSASGPSIARGIVYFGSEDGFLYAADTDSGEIQWKFKTGGPVVCPPAIRKRRLYLGSMDGFIYVIR